MKNLGNDVKLLIINVSSFLCINVSLIRKCRRQIQIVKYNVGESALMGVLIHLDYILVNHILILINIQMKN